MSLEKKICWRVSLSALSVSSFPIPHRLPTLLTLLAAGVSKMTHIIVTLLHERCILPTLSPNTQTMLKDY